MGRRPASFVIATIAAWAFGCDAVETPPDVLLITIDTLRADRLGVYGYPLDTSPHIDALAAQGAVFDRAIAAAGRTTPAHASIFTSRYVRGHTIGFRNGDSELRGGATLAEIFSDAGYATGAFVGNILLAGRLGFARGFDVYDDDLTTPERNRPRVVERRADDTTDRALRWLAQATERPTFLWVHYQDPHGPYTPPAPFDTHFEIAAPADEPELRLAGVGGRLPRYQAIDGLRRPSDYEELYCGEIAYVDRAIGRLLSAFDARGRAAVVLLTADHGESLGEEGHYFKHTHTTTPDVAHVPLILRAPGIAPQRRGELVSHVDVLPTLLELAGLPLPADAAGIALGPPLLAGEALPERHVFCDHGEQLSAYTSGGFLRVQGAGVPWRSSGESLPTHADRYRWEDDGSFRRTAKRVPLPPEVTAYAERVTRMQRLPPPKGEQLERLRALGYAE